MAAPAAESPKPDVNEERITDLTEADNAVLSADEEFRWLTNLPGSSLIPLQNESSPIASITSEPGTPDSTSSWQSTGNENAAGPVKKIPRPMNAFMMFAREYRTKLRSLHPTDTNRNLSVRLGQMWRDLPDYQKQVYFDKAKCEDMSHKRKYPYYRYVPNAKKQKMDDGKSCYQVCTIVHGPNGPVVKEMSPYSKHNMRFQQELWNKEAANPNKQLQEPFKSQIQGTGTDMTSPAFYDSNGVPYALVGLDDDGMLSEANFAAATLESKYALDEQSNCNAIQTKQPIKKDTRVNNSNPKNKVPATYTTPSASRNLMLQYQSMETQSPRNRHADIFGSNCDENMNMTSLSSFDNFGWSSGPQLQGTPPMQTRFGNSMSHFTPTLNDIGIHHRDAVKVEYVGHKNEGLPSMADLACSLRNGEHHTFGPNTPDSDLLSQESDYCNEEESPHVKEPNVNNLHALTAAIDAISKLDEGQGHTREHNTQVYQENCSQEDMNQRRQPDGQTPSQEFPHWSMSSSTHSYIEQNKSITTIAGHQHNYTQVHSQFPNENQYSLLNHCRPLGSHNSEGMANGVPMQSLLTNNIKTGPYGMGMSCSGDSTQQRQIDPEGIYTSGECSSTTYVTSSSTNSDSQGTSTSPARTQRMTIERANPNGSITTTISNITGQEEIINGNQIITVPPGYEVIPLNSKCNDNDAGLESIPKLAPGHIEKALDSLRKSNQNRNFPVSTSPGMTSPKPGVYKAIPMRDQGSARRKTCMSRVRPRMRTPKALPRTPPMPGMRPRFDACPRMDSMYPDPFDFDMNKFSDYRGYYFGLQDPRMMGWFGFPPPMMMPPNPNSQDGTNQSGLYNPQGQMYHPPMQQGNMPGYPPYPVPWHTCSPQVNSTTQSCRGTSVENEEMQHQSNEVNNEQDEQSSGDPSLMGGVNQKDPNKLTQDASNRPMWYPMYGPWGNQNLPMDSTYPPNSQCVPDLKQPNPMNIKDQNNTANSQNWYQNYYRCPPYLYMPYDPAYASKMGWKYPETSWQSNIPYYQEDKTPIKDQQPFLVESEESVVTQNEMPILENKTKGRKKEGDGPKSASKSRVKKGYKYKSMVRSSSSSSLKSLTEDDGKPIINMEVNMDYHDLQNQTFEGTCSGEHEDVQETIDVVSTEFEGNDNQNNNSRIHELAEETFVTVEMETTLETTNEEDSYKGFHFEMDKTRNDIITPMPNVYSDFGAKADMNGSTSQSRCIEIVVDRPKSKKERTSKKDKTKGKKVKKPAHISPVIPAIEEESRSEKEEEEKDNDDSLQDLSIAKTKPVARSTPRKPRRCKSNISYAE